ncbi:MAG: hypothetical protein K8T89_18175 [Planctomycetes bacterium]|nr:hypothetical protein [Planctomycetota bacterium]
MLAKPTDPSVLIAFIRDWFRLLSLGQMNEASQQLDEQNCWGIRWTPEYIRNALELAFGPGCRFRVEHPEGPQFSDPDSATGAPHAEVWELDDKRGYGADHDVPLNGEWSDLTAQFEFLDRPNGLSVVLHDLHVL